MMRLARGLRDSHPVPGLRPVRSSVAATEVLGRTIRDRKHGAAFGELAASDSEIQNQAGAAAEGIFHAP
jgi:hypothetical protein